MASTALTATRGDFCASKTGGSSRRCSRRCRSLSSSSKTTCKSLIQRIRTLKVCLEESLDYSLACVLVFFFLLYRFFLLRRRGYGICNALGSFPYLVKLSNKARVSDLSEARVSDWQLHIPCTMGDFKDASERKGQARVAEGVHEEGDLSDVGAEEDETSAVLERFLRAGESQPWLHHVKNDRIRTLMRQVSVAQVKVVEENIASAEVRGEPSKILAAVAAPLLLLHRRS
mmetsp:Transcript_27284/g.89075  ORF Transcript_27284/g.89075 Transcript_27284/m.89075 type:complete len:230 (+) Transcript_27284:540-1229(+)